MSVLPGSRDVVAFTQLARPSSGTSHTPGASPALIVSRAECRRGYLDAIALRVRSAGRVVSLPVLDAAWRGFDEDLARRGLATPLLRKVPKRALAEVREDFHRIVYAPSAEVARAEMSASERKWGKRGPGVVRSLQEGGAELLTGEFRRRVKTQSALPSEDAAGGRMHRAQPHSATIVSTPIPQLPPKRGGRDRHATVVANRKSAALLFHIIRDTTSAGPTVADRIENERTLHREMRLPRARQAERLVRQAVSRGTTHIRTHVDVDTDVKLANFEGVLEARERVRSLATIGGAIVGVRGGGAARQGRADCVSA